MFVDRPVTVLDRGGRFLVWSMRRWSSVVCEDRCPGPALAPAFARWRMIGGLQPFVRLMIALQRDAMRPLRFCALPCNRISEDEAIMLSLMVAAQTERRVTVSETLALLVAEDNLGDALGAVFAIAGALGDAELAPGYPQAGEP
jgi:hypothetical protein